MTMINKFEIKKWDWVKIKNFYDAGDGRMKMWAPKYCWGNYDVTLYNDGVYIAGFLFDGLEFPEEDECEQQKEFSNLEDAKKWCWDHWVSILSKHLITKNAE